MTIYICDKFSLSMLDPQTQRPPRPGSWHDTIEFGTRVPYPLTLEQAQFYVRAGSISAINNHVVADIVGTQLGMALQVREITVKLQPGDYALIAQFPEDEFSKSELRDGTAIQWWLI